MTHSSRHIFFLTMAALLTSLPVMTCQASLIQVLTWDQSNFSGTATLEFDAPSGNQDNLISCTAQTTIQGTSTAPPVMFEFGQCRRPTTTFDYVIDGSTWALTIDNTGNSSIFWGASIGSSTGSDFATMSIFPVPGDTRTLVQAISTNQTSQVGTTGQFAPGGPEASGVPAPVTLLLVGLGLAVLGISASRSRAHARSPLSSRVSL